MGLSLSCLEWGMLFLNVLICCLMIKNERKAKENARLCPNVAFERGIEVCYDSNAAIDFIWLFAYIWMKCSRLSSGHFLWFLIFIMHWHWLKLFSEVMLFRLGVTPMLVYEQSLSPIGHIWGVPFEPSVCVYFAYKPFYYICTYSCFYCLMIRFLRS